MRAALAASLLLVVGACGDSSHTGDGGTARMPPGAPSWVGLPGARLAPLPAQTGVHLGYFQTADACAQCHTTADNNPALRDAKGRDVSPVLLYRAAVMSLAARDPFYLASFSHELAAQPGAKDLIDATCSRCHAPAADIDLGMTGKHVTFDLITTDTSPEGHLARDGIGCVVCHQINPNGLGTPASFGGQFTVSGTTIFGRYMNPLTQPMQFFVSYTPAYGAHMVKSELCATCHTVITRALDAGGQPSGPAFYEQAAYLEWQNSSFVSKQSCQDCHVPLTDDDGAQINTQIARPPSGTVQPRTPFGRHLFIGANAYLLRVLADNVAWAGTATAASELLAQADRSDGHVASGAVLSIARALRDGGDLVVDVKVENRAGHKLPTGYPSRRAFLHVTVKGADGATVFESGRTDDLGRLLDQQGNLVDVPGELHPHRDVVTASDQVQIYEAVPGDGSGKPAIHLLDATSYLKDNRLLPAGWSKSGPSAAVTAPVGTDSDGNFGATDTVTYRVPAAAGALSVDVELVYQTLRPTDLDALAAQPTDASRRFFDMVAQRPVRPVRVAHAQANVN